MTAVDWSILERDGVVEIAERVARSVARDFDLDEEDVLQEAYMALATHATEYHEFMETGQEGLVYHRVRCDMLNIAQSEVRKTGRNVSLDALLDGVEDE